MTATLLPTPEVADFFAPVSETCTLYARHAEESIGWVLVRGDHSVVDTGACRNLTELALQQTVSGAPRLVIKSLFGKLTAEALRFAAKHGWEIDPH